MWWSYDNKKSGLFLKLIEREAIKKGSICLKTKTIQSMGFNGKISNVRLLSQLDCDIFLRYEKEKRLIAVSVMVAMSKSWKIIFWALNLWGELMGPSVKDFFLKIKRCFFFTISIYLEQRDAKIEAKIAANATLDYWDEHHVACWGTKSASHKRRHGICQKKIRDRSFWAKKLRKKRPFRNFC